MLTEFNALRARAKINRDKALADVQRDYELALEKIQALQEELLGATRERNTRLSAAIESVMPREADFTSGDLLAALENLEPGRAWKKRSIDNHIAYLRERGLVRRLKRSKSNEPAVYVRVAEPLRGPQTEDMPLREAIGQALTKPMNTTEVLVAVLESGYQTEMSKSNLRHTIAKLLGRDGYKRDGGKWLP